MNLDIIRAAMDERNITVRQLADMSAVPKSTLERILNGTTPNPTFQTMADIAVALNLSLDDLAGIDRGEIEPAHPHTQIVHSCSAEMSLLYRSMLLEKDQWIKRLSIAVTVLVIYQMFRWLLDVANPDLGWIRLQNANTDGISVFFALLFALVLIRLLFPRILKGKDKPRD